jgi:hypothetical protein
MLEFRNEKFDDALIEELKPLIERHYQEVAAHRQHVPLDPDWARFKKVAELDAMLFVGARDEGRLVGYSLFIISHMMHYMSTKSAMNDVVFLAPEYRQGMAGIKLMKFCETELARLGVKKVLWSVKVVKDFRKILYRMKYQDEDVILSKIIKE